MPRRIKSILFDVDGTLLDTKEYIYGAFNFAITKHGLDKITQAQIDAVIGQPLVECYKILAPNGDVELLCNSHRQFQENNLNLSKSFKNTKSVLKQLKKKGYKLGAVTNRSNTVLLTLKQDGLLEYFNAVVTSDDLSLKKLKPNPEHLLFALKKISGEPEFSLMVGDTPTDMKAGKAAGIKTVGATYGAAGKAALSLEKPDYLIDDLFDLLKLLKIKDYV